MSTSTQGITVEQLAQGTESETSHKSANQADISFNTALEAVNSTQRLHDVLCRSVQTLSPALPLHDILHSLATLAKQTMEMDLCVVLLMDQVSEQLTMQASF